MSVGPYIEVQWGTVEVSQTEQEITEDYSGNQGIKTVKVICLFVALCQNKQKIHSFYPQWKTCYESEGL